MSKKKNKKKFKIKNMDNVWKKRWLNPSEFYYKYDITEETQGKYRMDKKIPYSRIGGFIRYDVIDIDQWLVNHKVVEVKLK